MLESHLYWLYTVDGLKIESFKKELGIAAQNKKGLLGWLCKPRILKSADRLIVLRIYGFTLPLQQSLLAL